MADEGVIVLEKICSLKNSVKLKLALICGQTCHHIWKKLVLVLAGSCRRHSGLELALNLNINTNFLEIKVES